MFSYDKELIMKCKDDIKSSVKTVCLSCKLISKNDFENVYGITNLDERARKYQLDISTQYPFAICPVFFKNTDDDINICAQCFALLILSKGSEVSLSKSDSTYKLITSLINTIVLSAIQANDDNENCYTYWPTTITKTKLIETGTCNQTTIALSALLRVGFLNESTDIRPDALKERYKLVINALSWLTSIQNGDANTVWAYGEDCATLNQEPITYSVLSSHFCYETLKKYITFFNSAAGSNERAVEINPRIIDKIHSSCDKFEKWVEQKLDDTGGVSKNNISDTSSVLHTCLCQIIFFFDNQNLSIEKLDNAVNYVLKNLNNLSFSDEDLLESYRYKYKTSTNNIGYKNDTYEIIPEFLFINYSSRLLKSSYSRFLSKLQKKKLREANYIAYKKLLERKTTITCNGTDGCLVLKGIQTGEEKKYPIYGLYDLQLCLIEFLSSLNNKKQSSIICKPFSIWSIVLLVLGIIGCAFSLYFALKTDLRGTISSILLSFTAFSIRPLIKLFNKNN